LLCVLQLEECKNIDRAASEAHFVEAHKAQFSLDLHILNNTNNPLSSKRSSPSGRVLFNGENYISNSR
jgi:hypothetical protein